MLNDTIIQEYMLIEDREILLAGPPPLVGGDSTPLSVPLASLSGGMSRRRSVGAVRVALYVMVLLACSAGAFVWGSKRASDRAAIEAKDASSWKDAYVAALKFQYEEWHAKEQEKTVNTAVRMMTERDLIIERAMIEIKRLNGVIRALQNRNQT